jgi:hypothetical protein
MEASIRVRCVCGWEVVGPEDKVIASTQDHGRRIHNMDSTREQVLAMAVPAGRAGERTNPRRAKPGAR